MTLHSLLQGFRGKTRPSRSAQRLGTFRPNLEVLETRTVPSTLQVGPNRPYHSITAAVTAANPGDTIKVDPGSYQEQVLITKDRLKLIGTDSSTTILAPATLTGSGAIVEVNGAQNVTIDHFTISGAGASALSNLNFGVRIVGGASASITHDHITYIQDGPNSGLQTGFGILVGRQAEGQTGSANIQNDVIDNYQKGGIFVSNVGSQADIENNVITGVGPTSAIAQNGIAIGDGAGAEVSNNFISGNQYTPLTSAAIGILVFNSPATGSKIEIEENTIKSNDDGIYLLSVNGRTEVENNQISQSTFDGIDLDGSTGIEVSQNSVSGSGNDGIALFDNSTGNFLDHNTSTNNGHDGIFVDIGSTGNSFSHNRLKGNTNFDAEDRNTGMGGTAGTGNRWEDNHGATDNKGGALVKSPHGHDDDD